MAKFKVGDKVRILDGSKIENYTGCWNSVGAMNSYIGTIQTIRSIDKVWSNGRVSYRMEDIKFTWDERGLELADSAQKIVITTDGKTTKARLYNDKQFIRQAVARCAPDDTFSFSFGAALALSRLNSDIADAKRTAFKEAKSFDWDGFKAGRFSVITDRDNIDRFLKECEKHSINWCEHKATEWNPIEKFDEQPDFVKMILQLTLNFESTDKCVIRVKHNHLAYSYEIDPEDVTVTYD